MKGLPFSIGIEIGAPTICMVTRYILVTGVIKNLRANMEIGLFFQWVFLHGTVDSFVNL